MKAAVKAVLALLIVGGIGWFAFHQYQFRQVNGRVVEVGLTTWQDEVEQVADSKPVLIYFYKKTTETQEQRHAVEQVAWWQAGGAKVVAVNCDHLENLPIAIRFLALRQPSFAVLYKTQEIKGSSGVPASYDDLVRLIRVAQGA